MDLASTTDSLHQLGYTVDGAGRRGATATVYVGHHTASGTRVALKVLDDSTASATFDREAQILAEIEHPNIARLIDFATLANGRRVLVTAWADGDTLAERFTQTGPLGTPAVRRVLMQLGDALDYLHSRGVVHRDLSLANIVFDDKGHLTLIDFGISRSDDHATATASGDLVGTTRYLAPELLAGESPSPATDQYAAAVIAYELAAGVWPFEEANTVGRTFHHHLSSQPIPLTERTPSAPPALEAAIERSLSKAPADRFRSMQEMVDAALDMGEPTHNGSSGLGVRLALAGVALTALVGAGYLTVNRDGKAENAATAAAAEATVDETPAEAPGANGSTIAPADPTPTTVWPSGLAVELDCNLLPSPGFEVNSLPANFWEDPSSPSPVALAPDKGVDGSRAVAIGAPGEFAAFGSLIDIRPDTEYVLAASVSFSELPFSSTMSVAWVDADFQLLDTESSEADLTTAAPGRALLDVPPTPAGAAFAVTRLSKDDSGGVLFADELVFAERDSACGQILLEDG